MLWINVFMMGVMTNCPKEPAAIMTPANRERFAGLTDFPTAPNTIPRNPAPPNPPSINEPIRSNGLSMFAIQNLLNTNINIPTVVAFAGLYLSAKPPKIGAAIPTKSAEEELKKYSEK